MLRYFPVTGRLVLTDDTASPPHVVFDTDDAMLCAKPDHVFVGSQVVPERTASSTGINGTQELVDTELDYYIATIDIPGVKVVRGLMRTTWASNPEPADNLWRQASGTHLDILDGVSQTLVAQDDTGGYTRVATMGGYTFFVNDLNHLVLRERLVIRSRDSGNPPANFNRARRQCTVSFRLLIGFFLQSDFTFRPGVASRWPRSLSDDVGGTSFIFSNINPGYTFPGRRMLFFMHSVQSSGTVGVNPSSVGAAISRGGIAGSGGNRTAVSLWDDTTSGSSDINVSVHYPSAVKFIFLHPFALGNASNPSSPEIVTNSASGTNSVSVTISMAPNKYAVIGVTFVGGSDNPVCTWTNAIGLGTTPGRTTFLAAASTAVVRGGNGSVTVTATWNMSGNMTILAAVYSA